MKKRYLPSAVLKPSNSLRTFRANCLHNSSRSSTASAWPKSKTDQPSQTAKSTRIRTASDTSKKSRNQTRAYYHRSHAQLNEIKSSPANANKWIQEIAQRKWLGPPSRSRGRIFSRRGTVETRRSKSLLQLINTSLRWNRRGKRVTLEGRPRQREARIARRRKLGIHSPLLRAATRNSSKT